MVLLAVAVGFAGGAALAALAGARRTDTAVSRFLAYAKSSDADVATDPRVYPAIGQLPQVEDWNEAAYMLMRPVDSSGQPRPDNINTIAIVRPGRAQPLMLAGRLPTPSGYGTVPAVGESDARDVLAAVIDAARSASDRPSWRWTSARTRHITCGGSANGSKDPGANDRTDAQ